MNRRNTLGNSGLVVCLLIAGCGPDSGVDRQPVHPVSGTITMSGGPLVGAAVTFAPRDGQPAAVGLTDAQGAYTLTTYDPGDGAAVGSYAVVVSKSIASAAEVAESQHGDGYQIGHGAEDASGNTSGDAVPQLYRQSDRTPLSATVEAGGANKFDFEIN